MNRIKFNNGTCLTGTIFFAVSTLCHHSDTTFKNFLREIVGLFKGHQIPNASRDVDVDKIRLFTRPSTFKTVQFGQFIASQVFKMDSLLYQRVNVTLSKPSAFSINCQFQEN